MLLINRPFQLVEHLRPHHIPNGPLIDLTLVPNIDFGDELGVILELRMLLKL